jgi:hypothetical protein
VTNPEDSVIGDIDELIDAALAVGPVDDYEADRYVKCDLCGEDWHGTPDGGCPGAWGDDDAKAAFQRRATGYLDMVQGVRLSQSVPPLRGPTGTPFDPAGWLDDTALAAAGWVDIGHLEELVERPASSGYTLAELERLRAGVWHGHRQQGMQWTHRLRFWALAVAYGHGGGHQLQLAEMDRVQVQEATISSWGGDLSATLRCTVAAPADITWTRCPDPAVAAPLAEVTPDRLNVELFGPSGWQHLGYAPGDGMQLECAVVWPPGHRRDPWTYSERWTVEFEVTIDAPADNIVDRLLNPPERRTR